MKVLMSIVAFVLFCSICVAQSENALITLKAKRGGPIPIGPSRLIIGADADALRFETSTGKFSVPRTTTSGKKLTLLTSVNGKRLYIPDISDVMLDYPTWTVLLANKTYGVDYQWAVPKGSDVKSSCIVTFESPTEEGRFMFVSGCRVFKNRAK
jgi:hypothetical protein